MTGTIAIAECVWACVCLTWTVFWKFYWKWTIITWETRLRQYFLCWQKSGWKMWFLICLCTSLYTHWLVTSEGYPQIYIPELEIIKTLFQESHSQVCIAQEPHTPFSTRTFSQWKARQGPCLNPSGKLAWWGRWCQVTVRHVENL